MRPSAVHASGCPLSAATSVQLLRLWTRCPTFHSPLHTVCAESVLVRGFGILSFHERTLAAPTGPPASRYHFAAFTRLASRPVPAALVQSPEPVLRAAHDPAYSLPRRSAAFRYQLAAFTRLASRPSQPHSYSLPSRYCASRMTRPVLAAPLRCLPDTNSPPSPGSPSGPPSRTRTDSRAGTARRAMTRPVLCRAAPLPSDTNSPPSPGSPPGPPSRTRTVSRAGTARWHDLAYSCRAAPPPSDTNSPPSPRPLPALPAGLIHSAEPVLRRSEPAPRPTVASRTRGTSAPPCRHPSRNRTACLRARTSSKPVLRLRMAAPTVSRRSAALMYHSLASECLSLALVDPCELYSERQCPMDPSS